MSIQINKPKDKKETTKQILTSTLEQTIHEDTLNQFRYLMVNLPSMMEKYEKQIKMQHENSMLMLDSKRTNLLYQINNMFSKKSCIIDVSTIETEISLNIVLTIVADKPIFITLSDSKLFLEMLTCSSSIVSIEQIGGEKTKIRIVIKDVGKYKLLDGGES